jgi:CRISPR-associated protein (TIGR02710 family)
VNRENLEIIERRVEKLQSFDGSEDWDGLLTGLADRQKTIRRNAQPHELVHAYFGTHLRNGETIELANHNLDKTPFGQSLRVFKTQYQLDYPQAEPYKVLVSMVGFSLEPVMHTLLTLQPEKVIFVFSQESVRFDGERTAADYIEFLIEHYITSYKPSIENICLKSTDTAEVFARVHEKIKQYSTKDKISVDVTGGKKSMDVAAFLAAAMHEEVGIYYVDYEDYNIYNGYPVWGKEFLKRLDNPYRIYNIEIINQAKELFRSANYFASHKLFDKAQKEMDKESTPLIRKALTSEREKINRMMAVSECLMYWDRFEYKDAFEVMNNIADDIDFPDLRKFVSRDNMDRLIYEANNQFEYIKELCLDRYANAERRYEQGRYDDALTRYAQSLEMCCKSRLVKYVIDDALVALYSDNEDENEWHELKSTWKKWSIDYAPLSGVLSWLLCTQNLNWRNDIEYKLTKNNNIEIKKTFMILFGIEIDSSNKKYKEAVGDITKVIERRNEFIHITSLAAQKEHVEQLKHFVEKMLFCIYGEVDISKYKLFKEFDDNGYLIRA